MQRKKVFQVLLLGLAGILLAHDALAQSLFTCPVAVQLFYNAFGDRLVIGNAVFEVLNADCADAIVEGKSGKVLLTLDTKIASPGQDMSLIDSRYVPVGSKFNIVVEARYTLWHAGWEINSFNFKSVQRIP